MSMNKSIGWGLVVVLFPVIAASKTGDAGCVVEEFRTLAMTVHNPTERLAAATQWLRANGDACSGKDMAFLKSASGGWLGSADSPAIQQVFDFYYNAKAKAGTAPAPAAAAAPPAADKAKAVVSSASEKAASPSAKVSATDSAAKDLTATALASAMATAAASKAAASLSKTK
jgi:hypothetical protein